VVDQTTVLKDLLMLERVNNLRLVCSLTSVTYLHLGQRVHFGLELCLDASHKFALYRITFSLM